MKKTKIFTQKLEKIEADGIFNKRYKDILIKEIGSKHGVYILYDKKGEPYYIGRASNIKKRLKDHFKDQHSGKWNRFSIYLTTEKQYIYGLEDAFISIVQPKGNKKQPLRIDNKMISRIDKAIKQKDDEIRISILWNNKPKNKNNAKQSNAPSFKNPFGRNKTLKKKYKNTLYKAIWLKSGRIKYNNKCYNSPTSVAKAVSGRKIINGKTFWHVQDNNGEWIKIKDCS